jgi:hypothetical protein
MEQRKPWLTPMAGRWPFVAIVLPGSIEAYQSWDSFHGDFEKRRVVLDANAFVSDRDRCSDSRASAHERVKHDAFAKGQRSPNDLTHERLGLQ